MYLRRWFVTMLFYLDLTNFCQKTSRSKNYKQKLRHQAVEAEAIQIFRFYIPHYKIASCLKVLLYYTELRLVWGTL